MNSFSTAGLPHDSVWARALDRTGVIASVGCALHCMVAPLLLLAAPTLGGIWVHPGVHLGIAGLVLPVAALALYRGFRGHGRRWVLPVGMVGMVLVLLGALWPLVFAGVAPDASGVLGHAHDGCHDCCPSVSVDQVTGAWSLRVPPASIITLVGGIGLVAAHIGNLRYCVACRTSG